MDSFQIIISAVLSVAVLVGISMMSKVKTSVQGNLLSALALLLGVIATLYFSKVVSAWTIYPAVAIGALIGSLMAARVQMIQMPQVVALFNGLGGGASALVGIMSATELGFRQEMLDVIKSGGYFPFVMFTSMLAIAVGMITLVGSLVAAGKLHRVLPQKPLIWFSHSMMTLLFLVLTVVFIMLATMTPESDLMPLYITACVVFSSLFGLYFSVRVGGADMPITISLLNSLSGVAGSIAGMAISDILLVAVGGIVGASGLLLTQIMCRAMNRSLMSILLGGAAKPQPKKCDPTSVQSQSKQASVGVAPKAAAKTPASVLAAAKDVIIVPGYGMALAQAQHLVKQLSETLESRGVRVRFAIHPVAGRMPGHMNVLLAEADVSYEKLFEMEAINDDFGKTDAVVVIGANDVMNPAARDAEGTPIYGMPVLNVDAAPEIIICNFDLKPGYAGVENPLYSRSEGVFLQLGDAKKTLQDILTGINMAGVTAKAEPKAAAKTPASVLAAAKDVIIVPGYGMALAQAQHLVKQLSETLENRGARVRFAIHPVAGRMPGHMNVLLAEADVSYEKLFEMEAINDDFGKTDAVVVVGANDVLNPAARDAEGTPIYGMPVLNVDAAPEIIICNFDLKPGYAGVENPLYSRSEGVFLQLGDAKKTLQDILTGLL
ncbi:MAG: NAD(P)(+) transhydrogenase (Re/Si-specific) subunit beta [Prevotellaceae bacterium]|nr:NAD(P)(+) transhydrogenase (Re/Si-specific) subunit beta [Prevotellaceae bacterium]